MELRYRHGLTQAACGAGIIGCGSRGDTGRKAYSPAAVTPLQGALHIPLRTALHTPLHLALP
jgi:hypothetical protein